MKRAVAVSIFLLVTLLAVGQGPQDLSRTETSMLIALENAWNQAQLHHDSKALDALVADSFISTDNDGVLMTKAQFLEDNKDPSYGPTVMANSDVKVLLYKGTAVVAGVCHAKGTNAGKSFDHYRRFTDTWVYLNGKWQCVASHTSDLKRAPVRE
jgi:hypothetical protein